MNSFIQIWVALASNYGQNESMTEQSCDCHTTELGSQHPHNPHITLQCFACVEANNLLGSVYDPEIWKQWRRTKVNRMFQHRIICGLATKFARSDFFTKFFLLICEFKEVFIVHGKLQETANRQSLRFFCVLVVFQSLFRPHYVTIAVLSFKCLSFVQWLNRTQGDAMNNSGR